MLEQCRHNLKAACVGRVTKRSLAIAVDSLQRRYGRNVTIRRGGGVLSALAFRRRLWHALSLALVARVEEQLPGC
jgi:hypothetical protein